MKLLVRNMLFILSIILLVACGSQAVEVEGTVWQLMSINGEWPIAGTEITLRFEEERVKGSSGCNSYDGEYTIGSDGTFSAGPIAVTDGVS